jgi:hypothetical protein
MAGANPGAADIVPELALRRDQHHHHQRQRRLGNNYDGTYIGNNGNLPGPSQDVAPIAGVNNPRSRDFNRTNREAVQRTNMPTALKPLNELTLSVWYKAQNTDTSGSELISAGDNYSLRLRPGLVEFSKRINDGTAHWVQCDGPINTVTTTSGTTSPRSPASTAWWCTSTASRSATNAEGGNIVYDQGNTFFVGRHGNGQQNWDFQGLMDDVRVYGRALQANEVQDLFGRAPAAEVVLQWRMDEISKHHH